MRADTHTQTDRQTDTGNTSHTPGDKVRTLLRTTFKWTNWVVARKLWGSTSHSAGRQYKMAVKWPVVNFSVRVQYRRIGKTNQRQAEGHNSKVRILCMVGYCKLKCVYKTVTDGHGELTNKLQGGSNEERGSHAPSPVRGLTHTGPQRNFSLV